MPVANGQKVTKTVKDESAGAYLVPAPLVHKVLWGIVLTLITLGGYMAAWYVNDQLWKQDIAISVATIKGHDAILRREIDELREEYDKHDIWANREERNIEARMVAIEKEQARLKK